MKYFFQLSLIIQISFSFVLWHNMCHNSKFSSPYFINATQAYKIIDPISAVLPFPTRKSFISLFLKFNACVEKKYMRFHTQLVPIYEPWYMSGSKKKSLSLTFSAFQ